MHKDFMRAALEQAWMGRGVCAPNPSVGAVLVHNQQIVAKAFHPGVGQPHAEQLLLNNLPAGLDALTLYVTLEPCNHWGRTPPCVDFIINSPIKKVVFAFRDPNPLVSKNNTPAMLQEKGIDVEHFSLPEVDDFYQSYQHWFCCKRPWVTAKIAQSLDGKIAAREGQRSQLSNAACAEFTHQQRLYTDVILTTARTILADNPLLNARVEGKPAIGKTLAILDSKLRLTGDESVFQHTKQCHIFYDESLKITNSIEQATYHPISTSQGKLDLHLLMNRMGDIGFHDVWVEAGGKLFSELHDLKLVNTTYFYLVPKILGEKAVCAYHSATIFERKHRITWQAEGDNMVMRVDWALEDVC